MRRIVELPEGGGAQRGLEVWFALGADDGEVVKFAVEYGRFEGLMTGLEVFRRAARDLRRKNDLPDLASTSEAAEGFRLSKLPDGGLEFTLDLPRGPARLTVPAEAIRPFLAEIVKTLA